MNDDLTIIKDFEAQLKEYLIKQFGAFLPQDKVSILNNTSYITKEVLDKNTIDEKKSEITRNMLGSLMTIKCYKEMNINGTLTQVLYGEDLEKALIEYYAKDLSEKFGFDINEIKGLSDDLETVKLLDEKLDGKLDSKVFNSDALKLLDGEELKEIAHKYDTEELEKYLARTAYVSEEKTKQEENEMFKNNTERLNSIQVVWLNDKKNIKYIDDSGKVHLIDISNAPSVEEFYKEKLANLKPDEKLDPEEFFHELKELAKETELHRTEDINKKELNHQQVNMLKFIKSNSEFKQHENNDIVKHNSEINIHVLEDTNDIVTTDVKDTPYEHVEANIVKDGSAEMTDVVSQNQKDASEKVLTYEEFKLLFEKQLKGQQLTEEELMQLKNAAPLYFEELQKEQMNGMEEKEEKGSVLSPYKKNPYYGFANKNFILYVFIITMVIALMLSVILQSVN